VYPGVHPRASGVFRSEEKELKLLIFIYYMAHPERFELPTTWFVACVTLRMTNLGDPEQEVRDLLGRALTQGYNRHTDARAMGNDAFLVDRS